MSWHCSRLVLRAMTEETPSGSWAYTYKDNDRVNDQILSNRAELLSEEFDIQNWLDVRCPSISDQGQNSVELDMISEGSSFFIHHNVLQVTSLDVVQDYPSSSVLDTISFLSNPYCRPGVIVYMRTHLHQRVLACRFQRTMNLLQAESKELQKLYPLRYTNRLCLWSRYVSKAPFLRQVEVGMLLRFGQGDLMSWRKRKVGMQLLKSSMVQGTKCRATILSVVLTEPADWLHTHAFRIRWSSSDWYASYRILGDSSTLPPWSEAYFTNLLDVIGNNASWDEFDWMAGSRNGNDPVGEAWLLEETRRWSTPAIFRKAYGLVRK